LLANHTHTCTHDGTTMSQARDVSSLWMGCGWTRPQKLSDRVQRSRGNFVAKCTWLVISLKDRKFYHTFSRQNEHSLCHAYFANMARSGLQSAQSTPNISKMRMNPPPPALRGGARNPYEGGGCTLPAPPSSPTTRRYGWWR
jgi:hypothetical protein